MEQPTPQKEHEWLQRLVGEWTFESEPPAEAKDPSCNFSGTESVRSIGGVWFLAEGEGQMGDGGTALTLMTLGYDPQQQRYVGTWAGSMMTHLWIYKGTLDESGARLTLETEGPSMSGNGSTQPYRDVIEFLSDEHRTLTSFMQGDDGEWKQFVRVHYHKQK